MADPRRDKPPILRALLLLVLLVASALGLAALAPAAPDTTAAARAEPAAVTQHGRPGPE